MARLLTVCSAVAIAQLVANAAAHAEQPVGVGQTLQLPAGALPPGTMPPRDPTKKVGDARVRGRVVTADTGQPLRRALVRANAPDIREMFTTFTDADGVFEFKELPAGRYTVSASKGAYATLAFGQTRPFESGRSIELKDNQTVDRIDIRLPRGGVVTGTVVDELGEPLADAMVAAMRYQFIQGRRQLVPAGRSVATNDIGAFRLFGLTPGTYVLSVTVRSEIGAVVRNESRTGYAPTYYPGTNDVAGAQPLTIRAGQTLNDINLTLLPVQTAQISGTVLDANGQRVSLGMVLAMRRGALMSPVMGPAGGSIRPDGTFTVSDVSPGEYTLRAMTPGDGGGPGAQAVASVTVSGQGVSGVQLVPVQPAIVSGRIVLDGGTVPSLQGSQVQLMASPVDPSDGGLVTSVPPIRPRDDLSFELKAGPGQMLVRLLSDSRWALKAVRHQGVDVTDSGIDARAGASVSDVEVELTSRRQEITGLVTNNAKQPANNYTVVVFPQDRARWTSASRYIGVGRPDQDGRFRVRLPPGDYHAAAVDYVEPGAWMDPEFLESVLHAAVTVSLNEAETKTLDLRLAESR